jgi:hypothetical protein
MSEVDSWSVFEDTASTPQTADVSANKLEPLADEYAKLKSQSEAIADRLGQLENEIAYLFPEEAGEIAQSTTKFEVIVSRAERWSWDKEALERKFGEGSLPDHIKRSLSVDKRKFQKLPQHEQETLRYALTRKLDRPKVKVIPNV